MSGRGAHLSHWPCEPVVDESLLHKDTGQVQHQFIFPRFPQIPINDLPEREDEQFGGVRADCQGDSNWLMDS